ncbi:MAG: hypothetical protein H7239_12180 [Flavobacterium sp.]|nr:hypothetical protein [Flavobacterium sp.]
MRKLLQIAFYMLLALYFLPLIIPIKSIADSWWHKPIYFLLMIFNVFYESINLINDDKINKTHRFRNRLLMMIIGLVVFYLSTFIMKKILTFINLGFLKVFILKIASDLNTNNLFNKTYIKHLPRLKNDGIPNIGRNIVLGVQFSI